MQIKYLVNWLKLFTVSFAVTAIGRIWFEQYVFGSVKSYGSVALFAGIVAVAIATAQAVLAPRPRPDMQARRASLVPVPPMYAEQSIQIPVDVPSPAYKIAPAPKKAVKKKAKKSKRRK